ncbi:MAG: PBSX family phage terminase large subunit [Oscillospiraceae bacterium]|nr:PBSX family phage terminase large subunit [Oscillospiraceae bacterium]
MKTSTINPVFSDKHKAYISRAESATVSVAEGAVRAGKTIDNVLAFAKEINRGTPDRIHLATGSTSANAKLNIGDANGFGLEYIFRGRCKWTKYRGNEALVINIRNRQYIVIFAGGGKADSNKRIRGNSYGMWIATEINLHHENMVQEAFNRQLAAKNRKIFWDLNPSSPASWIYKNYIDRFPEQFGARYNYEHFTISDNAVISEERLKEIEAQYTPGSIWYRRDILGERCNAEGLVYPMYDNTVPTEEREYEQYYISVDFGVQNPTAMLLWGLCNGVWYLVREYYHSGRETNDQRTVGQYYDALDELADGLPIKSVIIDPSAAPLVSEINSRRKYKVWKGKNNVISGIQHTAQCLSDKTIMINDCCERTLAEFGLYRWDDDATEDKVIKEDDHSMDAIRYFVETVGVWRKKQARPVPWLL